MKSCNGTNGCPQHNGVDQATICSVHCGARCCKYITIKIARPNSETDWDEVRWWLCHEGISVVKDEDDWMVIVETRCHHLQRNNLCGTYPYHPDTCKDYDATNCEYTGPVEFEVCLATEDDLAKYIERRGLRRGARIAKAIRRSQRTTKHNPHYLTVEGSQLPLVALCETPR